jgi:NodT family efflux transporter outer membrane factor (OMF) lipoprotein
MRKSLSRPALGALTMLAACKAGPNYVRPAAIESAQYKEAALFRPATPADAIDRGPWWRLFGDPELDRLAGLVAANNQDVTASAAAYREAVEVVREQRAALFPQVGVSGGVSRSGSLGGSRTTIITPTVGGTSGTGTGGTGTGGTGTGTGSTTSVISSGGTSRFNLGASASWTPDLFGGTRRSVEAARRNAEANAADLANLALARQSELVIDYLQLRSDDAERLVLDETTKAYARDLQINKNRYVAGVATKRDVLQAETQLLNAQVSAADLVRARGLLEHAIAVLVGRAPAGLTIAPRAQWTPTTPTPPPGIPSALLERRPDVAAAERRVAAQNARVGVASAAFFPDVTLSGSFSQSATSLGSLFALGSNVWSLGANIAYTLLDFGARRARVAEARAFYDQTVAQYRQITLSAFQQVEDDLLATRVLDQEYELQQRSAAASSQAEALTRNQYKAGQVDYTTVVVSETTALNARRAAIQAGFLRQSAAAQLIQALGGGWSIGIAQPPVRPVRPAR